MDNPGHTPTGVQNNGHTSDGIQIDPGSGHSQAEAFKNAVRQNNIEWLNSNLERDKTLLDITFNFDFSEDGVKEILHLNALALASATGQFSVVNVLLEHGASAETHIPIIGGSALHFAARWGGFEIVRLLVERQANINQADKYGRTPLHLGSKYNKLGVVTYLLDNDAHLDVTDKEKCTAFHLACEVGALEVAKLLWERGSPSQLYDKNTYLNQPIHIAAINKRPDIIPWLLDRGASACEPGQNGSNALHQACAEGCTQTVKAILDDNKTDSSIIHTFNHDQRTPLLLACLYVRPEIVDILLKRNALVSDMDKSQDSCYHQVVMNCGEFSEDHQRVLDRLAGAGADIDRENRQGQSPLLLACMRGNSDCIKSLLALGASASGRNAKSPLLEASLHDNTKALEYILETKPDLSFTNNHGLSALALACRFGKLHNVKLLIAKGANITARTKANLTPLCLAANENHVEVMIEILRTTTYYPSYSLERKLPDENDSCRLVIANSLIRGFGNTLGAVRSIMMDNVGYILYWAIRMNCVGVILKYNECKPHGHGFSNLQGANWLHLASYYGCPEHVLEFFANYNLQDKTKTGATAFHLAVVNGTLGTTRFLLDLISKRQTSPINPIPKIDAIIECDNYGDSPLALSVKRNSGAHKHLADIFWLEFEVLGTPDYKRKLSARTKTKILETLAQYERSGRERVLKSLLEQWSFASSTSTPDSRTALEWAVLSKQPIVVWWLLSKGGYSSTPIMDNATYLAQRLKGGVGYLIQDLLKSPPPTQDYVANPNDDRPPNLPQPTQDNYETSFLSIIDIHEDGAAIKLRCAHASTHDTIYEPGPRGGPSAFIQQASMTMNPNDLESIRAQFENAKREDRVDSDFGIEDFFTDASVRLADSQQFSNDIGKRKVRWVHLPENKLHVMRDLCTRLSHDSERSEMEHDAMINRFNRSWTELAAGAGHRYMKPHCEHAKKHSLDRMTGSSGEGHENKEHPASMILYMPYLTLGTKGPGTNAQRRRQLDSFNETIHSRNKRDITHKPMTLDQYYYAVLQDTGIRDSDQVLTRYLEKYTQGRMDEKIILMVSQVWIWILDEETIITVTNKPEGRSIPDFNDPRSIFQTVLDRMVEGEGGARTTTPTSAHAVMELMLGVATNTIVSDSVHSMGRMISPIDIFRESIQDVMNEEAELFQEFVRELEQINTDRTQVQQNLWSPSKIPRSSNHVIDREAKLLREIRDIRDELGMLKSLSEHQENVWKQVFETEELRACFQYYHPCTPTDIKGDLDTMVSEADRVIDSLNSLLDLRTKQAALKEAEYGRIQAEDAARQSKSVLIFTIVTVIFLPLSFLSSLFALDVSSFPHESGSVKYESGWIFPILFGVTAIVSIPVTILALKASSISRQLKAESTSNV